MKPLRRVDLGIFVVIAICLLAIWPFLSRPGLPLETDAELHIVRTAELDHLLRGGEIYPRWAPDFYYGYGYPLFNYYAPLTYYLGAGLLVLPGVDAVLAVKLVFVLGLFGAGLGMYAFVRRLWGGRPGLVAAAVYLYAPYIQYIDPHARGVLAESFSFALFPWVLWAFTAPPPQQVSETEAETVRSAYNPWRLSLAAGLLAALICTHNLMALVFTTILVAWITWQLVAQQGVLYRERGSGNPCRISRSAFSFLGLAFILGITLSAFFWLPVILERDAVLLGNLISEGGHFDFRNHFLTLSELFQPTRLLDLGATDPHYFFNLGEVQWMLALLGGGILLWRRTPRRSTGLFFALVAALLLFLMLPISTPFWERIPLMPFLQFPWRLLGALSAFLALLAGVGLAALEVALGKRWADWATVGITFLVLLLAIPLTYPPEWTAEFGPTDPWGIIQRELQGRWLGTTSTGDYVPADVSVVPRPSSQVLESYRDGGSVDRVNRATLPAGTQVTLDTAQEQPLAWTYQIDGKTPFVFRLFHFYFPGWVATLDGQSVSIHPAKPDGFITVQVPAGQHQLRIAFQDTPARRASWIVSGIALAISLLIAARSQSASLGLDPPWEISPYFLLVPLVLFAFKVTLADPLGWFRLQSEGLSVAGADQTVYYQVGDHVALIGYDWHPADPGEMARLTLYWKALQPVPLNYQVFVHLRDSTGAVVAQSDRLNPGDYPTEQWPLDKYVRDEHGFSFPAKLPPGEYRLAVGLWLMADGKRLPVSDDAGNHLGDSIWLESQVIQ